MLKMISKLIICQVLLTLLVIGNAHGSEQFYQLTDYLNVNKVDAHVHANKKNNTFIEVAKKNNFRLISINVDYPDFPAIDTQQQISIQLSSDYPNTLAFASTFSMDEWDEADWGTNIINKLKRSFDTGAIAVKVWKNIGMDFKGRDDELVMLNNTKLSPIFDFLSQQGYPLIGHQGEPKNCWLPVEQMTVKNDKQYFAAHPQYHMYLHPEFPSYEEHMQVRNNVLDTHPKLHFVGAHFASLEWSVDELSKFLDRYPLAVVDTAARMGQIQFQSKQDYSKVRSFFIKYQDRLLYATDLTQQPLSTDSDFTVEVETKWRSDWRYLTSLDQMEDSVVEGSFKGLHLPRDVINKIYSQNALNAFQKAFKK